MKSASKAILYNSYHPDLLLRLIKKGFRHKATWMEIWDGDFEDSAMLKIITKVLIH